MTIKDMAAASDFTEAELQYIFADVGAPDFDITDEQIIIYLLNVMREARDIARSAREHTDTAHGLQEEAGLLLGDITI